jgi:hypothetical protein
MATESHRGKIALAIDFLRISIPLWPKKFYVITSFLILEYLPTHIAFLHVQQ